MSAGWNRLGRNNRANRKGFALVLTSLMMVFIVSLMGMAVDAGVLFAIRGRLSSAVASAALAAARSVNLAQDSADAKAKATEAAVRSLNANFPNNYLGVDSSQTSLTTDFTLSMQDRRPTGLLQIGVRAEVVAPVYFMKFWGVSKVPVSVQGKTSRRNLVLVMVLDKSASMGSRSTAAGTTPAKLAANATSCEGMVFAAGQMPDYFSPFDTVGMVSFDDVAYKDFPASPNFKGTSAGSLKDKISRISCGSSTNTTAALQAAYEEIQRIDQKLALNAVLLFTDGAPNGVTANFPLRAGVGMPAVCASANVIGVIMQTAGFALQSGSRDGLFKASSSDAPPAVTSVCPGGGAKITSQELAYIPDTDRFGNSTHGPKDNWTFRQCAPSKNSQCENFGARPAGTSPDANFFAEGPYAGKFRPDQANAIGAVSMNTAINQAIRMRGDASYAIRIDSIYLGGNGGDPVDRDFLPMVSNLQMIPPLIHQSAGSPEVANPLYNSNQNQGHYTQSAGVRQLGSIFAEDASSLLRLSQ